MNFLQINILILGFYGVFSYFFQKDRKKVKLYESIFCAIYFPIFIYFYFKNQGDDLELYVIQTGCFVLVLFESIVIFNIYKFIKSE
jgi:hypothetical protein